jgi:hypothetical protein
MVASVISDASRLIIESNYYQQTIAPLVCDGLDKSADRKRRICCGIAKDRTLKACLPQWAAFCMKSSSGVSAGAAIHASLTVLKRLDRWKGRS